MMCKKAVMWSLMANAESPRTLFELLFTRLPEGTKPRITYDNACNTMQYMLNREPEFCRDCELYIDALHFRGHKGCCTAYDTGAQHAASAAIARTLQYCRAHDCLAEEIGLQATSRSGKRWVCETPTSRTRPSPSSRTRSSRL